MRRNPLFQEQYQKLCFSKQHPPQPRAVPQSFPGCLPASTALCHALLARARALGTRSLPGPRASRLPPHALVCNTPLRVPSSWSQLPPREPFLSVPPWLQTMALSRDPHRHVWPRPREANRSSQVHGCLLGTV